MNSTLSRAGRTMHFKIVMVSLVASVALVTVGLHDRPDRIGTVGGPANDAVLKVGDPVTYAGHKGWTIR